MLVLQAVQPLALISSPSFCISSRVCSGGTGCAPVSGFWSWSA
jgi:hypothetical protein